MLTSKGLFSFFALSNASFPHGYQLTGLWACWRRYGDFSVINLLGLLLVDMESPPFIFIYQIFLSVKGDGLKEFHLNLDSTTSTKLRRIITDSSLFSKILKLSKNQKTIIRSKIYRDCCGNFDFR